MVEEKVDEVEGRSYQGVSQVQVVHKTRDAENILNERVYVGWNPDTISFNTLITVFFKENTMTYAKRIFSEMSNKGFSLN